MNVNDELIFHNENFGVTPDGSLKTGAYHGKATRSCNNLISELSDQDVYDKDCSSISISEGDITIVPGGSVVLHVNVNPLSSNTPEIIWESSDISVAYVTSSGILMSQNEGEATITATSSGDTSIFDSITVTVSGESGGNEYAKKYFTIEAIESGTALLTYSGAPEVYCSLDNGSTWIQWIDSIDLNANDKMLVKCKIEEGDESESGASASECSSGGDVGKIDRIGFLNKFNIEGNIMSLVYGDDFVEQTEVTNECFGGLFNDNQTLVSAKNLVLPATTLAQECYNQMFQDCTSLTEAPELPATTLAASCYNCMFLGCSSLTEAPELPATTLAPNCYCQMFSSCTSLTEAPELPATTLAEGCYSQMFLYCNELSSITCLATDISANNCTENWVTGVAASGTFTKNPEMTSWTTGNSGIPENWEVLDQNE